MENKRRKRIPVSIMLVATVLMLSVAAFTADATAATGGPLILCRVDVNWVFSAAVEPTKV